MEQYTSRESFFTIEEFRAIPKEEVLRALRIVQHMAIQDQNFDSHYLSGDKDTMEMAIENIGRKHGYTEDQKNEPHTMPFATIEQNHQGEVQEEFNRLVKQGKELNMFFNHLRKYLKGKIWSHTTN